VYITSALVSAGWNIEAHVLAEVLFTNGGKLTAWCSRKRSDYILYHKSNIPTAVIEQKPIIKRLVRELNTHRIPGIRTKDLENQLYQSA
jgi:type I site-specific restriction endonuclease